MLQLNPLKMNRSEEIAIGLGLAAAIAAGIYYYTRPAAAAAGSTAPASIVLQAGNQSVTLTAAPLTILLPSGAVWVTAVGNPTAGAPSYVGTANPLVIPANSVAGAPVGTSQTLPLQWSINGTVYTTNLTITAG